MRENIIRQKSFDFAIRIVKLYQFLKDNKHELILSKQLLRSGTYVGAMIREAEHSESKADFIHKMSISQKEINESIYWPELLSASEYLSKEQFESINNDAVEILKLLTSILKSSKSNHKNK